MWDSGKSLDQKNVFAPRTFWLFITFNKQYCLNQSLECIADRSGYDSVFLLMQGIPKSNYSSSKILKCENHIICFTGENKPCYFLRSFQENSNNAFSNLHCLETQSQFETNTWNFFRTTKEETRKRGSWNSWYGLNKLPFSLSWTHWRYRMSRTPPEI